MSGPGVPLAPGKEAFQFFSVSHLHYQASLNNVIGLSAKAGEGRNLSICNHFHYTSQHKEKEMREMFFYF